MKKIILILLLIIFIIGCTDQNKELPKINFGQETKVINDTTPVETDVIEEPKVQEPQNTKKLEVYNPETGENEVINLTSPLKE